MSPDWLSTDPWRAHISWLTPPWVGETEEGRSDFDSKRWLDVIEAAHYRTLIYYAKHHDGFCTFPSRYASIQPERDYLGECAAEVRRRGMRLLCYYSSFIDEVSGNEHPDWQVLGRDGKPVEVWCSRQWPGSYCCLNNPGYREVVLGQLTELRDRYNPDGLWMDVFEPFMDSNCFCPSCRLRYKRETGGDLFETVGNAWYQSCIVDLMERIREIADASDRPCAITRNAGKRNPALDRLDDFFTHEAFTATMISSLGRTFRPLGKPFETTCRLYSAVGTWAVRGPERVLLESLAAVVHGGACCQELSPTHTGRMTEEAALRVAEVGSYLREIEEFLVGTQPVFDAAVLQSESQYGISWDDCAPTGWPSVLMERDVPFAFAYPGADLSRYRLVILDDRVGMDESLAHTLARYVHEGGNLIVECKAAAFGTPAGDVLAPVLGLYALGQTGSMVHYLSALHPDIAGDMGADDLVVEGEAYRIALESAQAMAFCRYEFATRTQQRRTCCNYPPSRSRSEDPAVCLNRYGSGRAMYLACPLTTHELRNHRHNSHDAREYPTQFAANLARLMVGEPLLRDTTPAGVEVVVNAQGSRHIVHLLNHYVAGQYYDNRRGLLKLAEVRLSLNGARVGPVRKARLVARTDSAELPLERDGKWLSLRLPSLAVHALVVLE